MNYRFYPLAIVLIAFLSVTIPSCNKSVSENPDIAKTDSILAANANTIYTKPIEVSKELGEMQREIADSVCYYKLELFKGIAGLLGGNLDAYGASHRKTADYMKRNQDSYIVAGIYWNHEGMVQASMGNTDSAIVCYENSGYKMSQAKDWNRYSNVCINLADLYRSKGDLASSAKYYRRALFVADSVDNHTLDLSILSGLGSVYADMGNFEQSEKFFEKALPLLGEATDFEAFFYYNSAGNGLYFNKRYDEAIETFHKAYAMAGKLGQQDLLAIVETNLGEVMLYKDCLDSARYYLKSAESRFMSLPSIDESARFYINSMLAGLALRESNMPEAKKYLSTKVDTAVLRPRYMALHYRRMQEFYAKAHDYKSAYRYELLADRYDRIVNKDKLSNQMAEIRYRYDQDTTLLHKNLMIQQQAEEMEELSMWNYVAVGFIVLLVVIVVLYLSYRKKFDYIKRLEVERSLMQLRMENIRNRVSPHFIFNVLNRELAIENDGVNRLVRLLRTNLDLCDRYIVSLREEIEFIDTYVELERKALGDDFSYETHIGEDVDLDRFFLPSMMIQIFVENALKHGLRGVDGGKWLSLDIKHMQNVMEITIENNGSNHGVVAGRVGTGLKVVMQTIHILNERNTDKLNLVYGTKGNEGVWSVKITIPDGYDFTVMQQ